MPDMISVRSSNVARIGYDNVTSTAYVEFLSGALYAYYGVPQLVFENLRVAPSIGSYINVYFKNVYPYERIQ